MDDHGLYHQSVGIQEHRNDPEESGWLQRISLGLCVKYIPLPDLFSFDAQCGVPRRFQVRQQTGDESVVAFVPRRVPAIFHSSWAAEGRDVEPETIRAFV